MSIFKSLTIGKAGEEPIEFISKPASEILLPKENESDPDISIADKITEIETLISESAGSSDGGGGDLKPSKYLTKVISPVISASTEAESSFSQTDYTNDSTFFNNNRLRFRIELRPVLCGYQRTGGIVSNRMIFYKNRQDPTRARLSIKFPNTSTMNGLDFNFKFNGNNHIFVAASDDNPTYGYVSGSGTPYSTAWKYGSIMVILVECKAIVPVEYAKRCFNFDETESFKYSCVLPFDVNSNDEGYQKAVILKNDFGSSFYDSYTGKADNDENIVKIVPIQVTPTYTFTHYKNVPNGIITIGMHIRLLTDTPRLTEDTEGQGYRCISISDIAPIYIPNNLFGNMFIPD